MYDQLEVARAVALVAIAIAGAYLDWRFRRLPNGLCLIALIGGAGFTFALEGAGATGLALGHGVLAILVGMFLFSRGWIGGGDAKYYAGLAAWFPLWAGGLLIFCVSLAGLALLLVWYPFRRKLAVAAAEQGVAADHLKLPYGVAIAVGAVVAEFLIRIV